jgi:septal ring factor EnvC (AmiA/AmiB activator)
MTDDDYRKQWRLREVEIVREDIANVRVVQREHEKMLAKLHDRLKEQFSMIEQLQAKIGEVLVSLDKARELFKAQKGK